MSKLLLLICALSLVLSGPKVWALEVHHEAVCLSCDHDPTGEGESEEGETGGCDCACHLAVTFAVIPICLFASEPIGRVMDRIGASEVLAGDGPVFGVEYPPRNS